MDSLSNYMNTVVSLLKKLAIPMLAKVRINSLQKLIVQQEGKEEQVLLIKIVIIITKIIIINNNNNKWMDERTLKQNLWPVPEVTEILTDLKIGRFGTSKIHMFCTYAVVILRDPVVVSNQQVAQQHHTTLLPLLRRTGGENKTKTKAHGLR